MDRATIGQAITRMAAPIPTYVKRHPTASMSAWVNGGCTTAAMAEPEMMMAMAVPRRASNQPDTTRA